MTFKPGDRVIYNVTKREYIVEKSYIIKFDNQRLELIDVKPIKKIPSDKFRGFKGYSAKYFNLVK